MFYIDGTSKRLSNLNSFINLKARKNWNTINFKKSLPDNVHQSKCRKACIQLNQNNTNILTETKLPLIIHVSVYKQKNKRYKIIQIVRALWLAIKPFYMSVCKHGFRSSL